VISQEQKEGTEQRENLEITNAGLIRFLVGGSVGKLSGVAAAARRGFFR